MPLVNKLPTPESDHQRHSEELTAYSKKLGIVSNIRLAAAKIIDHPAFEYIQKAATATAVFGEPIYRGSCGLVGIPADEGIADMLREVPLAAFAANLGLKTTAKGMSHFKTPEAWIDTLSLAAYGAEFLPTENLRVLRMLKGVKGSSAVKFMRAADMASGKQELEDKSVEEIQRGHTWQMMFVLASTNLVADWKNIDYSNPVNAGKEILFSGGLAVSSKIFIEGSVRKTINKNYTQTLQGSRDRIHTMIDENPELEFLRQQFKDFDEDASDRIQEELNVDEKGFKTLLTLMKKAEESSVDPKLVWNKWAAKHGVNANYEDYARRIDRIMKNEIIVIIEGIVDTMVDMKELINPVGEDMELDNQGNIKTKELDAVVMVTDLRNFTSLSSSKFISGNILGFLKLNYFRYLRSVIKKHNGKILNHTGDGLVIYFTDQKNGKSKHENSIACAQEVNQMTNMMDEIWKEEGVSTNDENHETGIGLSSGVIRIGDILTLSQESREDAEPDSSIHGMRQVQKAFEGKLSNTQSEWANVIKSDLNAVGENKKAGISRLVGLGVPINLAARLESIATIYPDYTGFIRQSHYDQLSEDQQANYSALETRSLKGVEEEELVYGLHRYEELEPISKRHPEHTAFCREPHMPPVDSEERSKYEPLEKIHFRDTKSSETVYGVRKAA